MKQLALAPLLVAALAARAQSIETRSPFLPTHATAAAADGPKDPNALQLQGVMVTSAGAEYNIFDPAKKTSWWLSQNGSVEGLTIKSADPATSTVTIEVNGQPQVLTMKQSKTQAGVSMPTAPAPGQVILHPTPEDEQRRLQAVAEEVRRRRLLREQAANAQNQGQNK